MGSGRFITTNLPTMWPARILSARWCPSAGGLLPGNQAILLNNGDAFFPAILEAIRAAKLSVNIELYIFAKGRHGGIICASAV